VPAALQHHCRQHSPIHHLQLTLLNRLTSRRKKDSLERKHLPIHARTRCSASYSTMTIPGGRVDGYSRLPPTMARARSNCIQAGVLLEAIVTRTPALRQYILGLTSLLPFLGKLVTRGDEDLKLVSATLIRVLAGNDGQTLPLFWPAEELDSSQIQRFPLTDASTGKQWIEDLTAFMDDVFSQNRAINRYEIQQD
jgi:hypothetical protein